MTVLKYIILGRLQGVTEFLPVSSSGHLVLFGELFALQETLFVSILLHFATLLSVVIVLRKEIYYLLKNPFSKEMKNLVLSTLITVLIVLLIYPIAKHAYMSEYVPFFFMLTAVLLIAVDIFEKKAQNNKYLSCKQSLLMGIAQGLAVFPGLSRSGSTISVGLLAGGDKEKVAKHSFLMSLPIIFASMLVEIFELANFGTVVLESYNGLILGFLTAFIIGVFALRFMIKYTRKIKYKYFAYYLIILSIITLII